MLNVTECVALGGGGRGDPIEFILPVGRDFVSSQNAGNIINNL